MIRISKLSGEELCALDEKGLEDLSTKYGSTVRSLKRHIRTLTKASIYRQRLLLQNEELDDDQSLANLTAGATGGERRFLELQLLQIPWQGLAHPDLFSNYEKLREAIEQASSQEVERILRIPIHPDVSEKMLLDENRRSSLRKSLNKAGKNEDCGDRSVDFLRTAFYAAAKVGDPEIVGHLLDADADPNAQGRLKFAAMESQLEIARLLLEARAHPDGSRASRASRASTSSDSEVWRLKTATCQ